MISMKAICALLLSIFFSLSLYATNAKRVYILANEKSPDSLKVARHYAQARAIPEENIITLKLPSGSWLSRKNYIELLENPLLKKLIEKKAISAIDLKRKDELGRDEYLLNSINLDFLVLCYGVPWRIIATPQTELPKHQSKSNGASPDSEIAARFLSQKNLRGFAKNPAFGKVLTTESLRQLQIIPVARIDAPSVDIAIENIDRTIKAEMSGLRGRVYIDKSKYAQAGDKWLDDSAKILSAIGYDIEMDSERKLMDYGNRADGMIVYFGWYTNAPIGYFAEKSFKSANGAFGLHIYSFSAYDLKNTKTWTAALARDGFSAHFGNMDEPYLFPTHQPHIITAALAKDMTMGEAAMVSTPALSWQGIFIGDPLYRPFAKDLNAQLADIEAKKIDELSQYVVLRQANLIEKKGGDQIAYIKSQIGKMPDEALLFKIFSSPDTSPEEKRELAETLIKRESLKRIDFAGMANVLAKYFESLGEKGIKKAIEIYETQASQKISDKWKIYIATQVERILKKYPNLKTSSAIKDCIETKKKDLEAKAKKAKKK